MLNTCRVTRAVDALKTRGFPVDAVPGDLSVAASAREVGLQALERLGGLVYRSK